MSDVSELFGNKSNKRRSRVFLSNCHQGRRSRVEDVSVVPWGKIVIRDESCGCESRGAVFCLCMTQRLLSWGKGLSEAIQPVEEWKRVVSLRCEDPLQRITSQMAYAPGAGSGGPQVDCPSMVV